MSSTLRLAILVICGAMSACESNATKQERLQQANGNKSISGGQRADQNDVAPVDFSKLTETKGSGTWTNVFWLNFDGNVKISKTDSFIVDQAGLSEQAIAAFKVESLGAPIMDRADAIQAIETHVSDVFNGLEISFTKDKPGGTFSAIHIGGADFRKNSRALGVAPLDIDNFAGRDVGFAFPETLDPRRGSDANIRILANAIAHEIGHTLGASHIKNDKALMNPSVDIGNDAMMSGAKVPGPGDEDTLVLLTQNIGLIKNKDTSVLPTIVKLGFSTQGDVRQYTIYTKENVEANTARNLGLYRYKWQIGAKTAEGTSVRIPLSQRQGLNSLKITVSNDLGTASANVKTQTFSFPIEP